MSTAPASRTSRPVHTRPRAVALVALGGAVGTALRVTVAGVLTGAGTWPWATWLVNLTGAFGLGVLLGYLARDGPDAGARRDVRLLAGVGLLGGYTTYSTLALDTVTLAGSRDVLAALLYAGSSVALGVVLAAAGVAAGRLLHRGPGARR